MSGILTLIPTPIDEEHMLELSALNILKDLGPKDHIIVEEAKVSRRRWIRWGLDRSRIEDFILYNEHTRNEILSDLMAKLKNGENLYIMSDCGLPAFCDPGVMLVDKCHESNIKVTSTMFPNSIALAVALSGFPHDRFVFEGFIAQRGSDRKDKLKKILSSKDVSILMDTPYRLNSLLDEMKAINPDRKVFVGVNLNCSDEALYRDTLGKLNIEKQKNEFIVIVGPKS